jgi:hypothetical protein
VITSRKVRRAEHVERMEYTRNLSIILADKSEGNRELVDGDINA